MRVTTTSTSTETLAVPYTCHCAFCGAAIHGEEKIISEGHAFKRGYASGSQGEMMKLSASMEASANLPFELEYAEKRLAHYRDIVAGGRLKTFLETGKTRKEDFFRVDPGSALGNYLLHGRNKTQAQADNDKTRMTAFPYRWKLFDKSTAVKCPACGKPQPWSESMDVESIVFKAFLAGFGVCLLGCIPFMAGLKVQGAMVVLAFAPIALGIVVGILTYKAMHKKQLARLAALPWNADDLPRFDEDFVAGQKARYQQAKDMGIMP